MKRILKIIMTSIFVLLWFSNISSVNAAAIDYISQSNALLNQQGRSIYTLVSSAMLIGKNVDNGEVSFNINKKAVSKKVSGVSIDYDKDEFR
ncbi:hypothetical protein, partial [Butyribacter sp.]|uniref:hypothetical protein n=1 Tax=Butyribacter sp. TaxID=2822465 RepID=UPI002A9DE0BC|nr:hypothetical protein [Butyribacter sp.]